MDWQELEKHRADNQIWNAAAEYGFSNDFHSFKKDGSASLYFNTTIGLVHHHYDFSVLEKIFDELEDWGEGHLYTELLWLGLERLAWLKDKESRPALTGLRMEYAREYLEQSVNYDNTMLHCLKKAWFRRALALPNVENTWETTVLNDLEFSQDLTVSDLKSHIEELIHTHFKRTLLGTVIPKDVSHKQLFPRKKLYYKSWAVRHLGLGKDENSVENGFLKTSGSFFRLGQPRAEKVRDYVESCFGRSILSETEKIALEKKLCVKAHKDCYFHITNGEPSKRECKDDAILERNRFRKQCEQNKEYYNKRLVQNRLAIQQLSQRIRNTLLLKEDEEGCYLRTGNLKSTIAWRAIAVEDSQIFTRPQSDLPDDLIVDIVLDASASQLHRQEKIATQAYILAEALTKCDIPVRVLSYCSVSGCTVLRMYRNYYEINRNDKIFEYAAAGWNRDGLAFSGLEWLLKQSMEGHRLVLILSDANPNDDQKMYVEGRIPYSREYSGNAAIKETAAEVKRLRIHNTTVLCLYTGLDSNIENASQIYGRDMIRIQNMDTFAETVGKVIESKLQALS